MKIKIYEVGFIVTNCYLVWDEESREAMIIDPGAYEPAFGQEISSSGLKLKYIALTHGHGDHIGGVEKLMEAYPEAVLAAGADEAELLGDPKMNASGEIFGRDTVLEPGLLLSEGDELCLGGLSFKVIETPGHTPGGLTYYVQDWDRGLLERPFSGTAFTGDTLFQASIGRTDLPGGNFDVLMTSILEKLYTLPDDTIVLPGHMDVTTIENERRYNPFVR